MSPTVFYEVLGIKLSDSLTIGTTYHTSFKLSLSGGFGNSDACSHQGMKLSTKALPYLGTAPISGTNSVINNFAHVYTNQIMTDTTNWVTIKGSIVADSNYKYIYFGIFHEFSNINYIHLYGFAGVAYYYVDDVCLSTDSNTCKITSQVPCLSNGIGAIEAINEVNVSPNPTNGLITLEIIDDGLIPEDQVLVFTDVLGREVKKEKFLSKKQEIDLRELKEGIYYVRLQNASTILFTRKVIKQ